MSSLQLKHRRGTQYSAIEKQCFNKDLPVNGVGEPSRVDSWRLKRIGRTDMTSSSRQWMHYSHSQATSVVVDDLVGRYMSLTQSLQNGLLLASIAGNDGGIYPIHKVLGGILVGSTRKDARRIVAN